MELSDSKAMFGIEHEVICDRKNNQKCVLDIVTLSDFAAPKEEKVQVYISGALHGDERLGPHTSYYFIEMMVQNFGIDPYITELFRTREIILTPMSNAPGFRYN